MDFTNKNYKDSVFRLLFNNKKRLLELYNALNGTSHSNVDDLKIVTLKGHTFLNMKNDVSFILNLELNLYEHQSTPCPNIPLRDLYYFASSMMEIIPLGSTYQPAHIKLPTPKFLVFYNGTVQMKDKITYRLSDMFAIHTDEPSAELIVTVYNVNEGHNERLMETCDTLKGYSIFVAKVRKYKQEAEEKYDSENETPLKLLVDKEEVIKTIISSAVSKAIDECIQEDILREFFQSHRQEVIEMSFLECTAEEQLKAIADGSYENGVNDTISLFSWLSSNNRQQDIDKALVDSNHLAKLFEEYKELNPIM